MAAAVPLVIPVLRKVLHLVGPIIQEESKFLLNYKSQLQRLSYNVKLIHDFLEDSSESLSPHRNFNAIVEKAEELGLAALQLVKRCTKWDQQPHRSSFSPDVLYQHYRMGRRIAQLNQDFGVLHEDIRTFSNLQHLKIMMRQNEMIIQQNEQKLRQDLRYQETLVEQVRQIDEHLQQVQQPVIFVQNINVINVNRSCRAFRQPAPTSTSLEF